MVKPRAHLRPVVRLEKVDRGTSVGLDRNERVSPLDPEHFQEILRQLRPEMLCHYPDPAPLIEKLSQAFQLPIDHLSPSCGSDATIRRTFHAFLEPNDVVVSPTPTYGMYEVYAEIFQAKFHTLEYERDMSLDVERFLELIDDQTKLVCLANPDQPTGSTVSISEINRIAETARQMDAVLLVDEAYFPAHPESAIDLVARHDNLIVSRSFSKLWGLAGIRLGCAAAQPNLIESLNKVRGAHEVTSVAIAIGCYMLDRPELMHAFHENLNAGRAVLRATAKRLDLGFPSCPTNFQLLRLPADVNTRDIVRRMEENGFLIKGAFKADAVSDCIRVTLDYPEVMQRFCKALETSLAKTEKCAPPSIAAEKGR